MSPSPRDARPLPLTSRLRAPLLALAGVAALALLTPGGSSLVGLFRAARHRIQGTPSEAPHSTLQERSTDGECVTMSEVSERWLRDIEEADGGGVLVEVNATPIPQGALRGFGGGVRAPRQNLQALIDLELTRQGLLEGGDLTAEERALLPPPPLAPELASQPASQPSPSSPPSLDAWEREVREWPQRTSATLTALIAARFPPPRSPTSPLPRPTRGSRGIKSCS